MTSLLTGAKRGTATTVANFFAQTGKAVRFTALGYFIVSNVDSGAAFTMTLKCGGNDLWMAQGTVESTANGRYQFEANLYTSFDTAGANNTFNTQGLLHVPASFCAEAHLAVACDYGYIFDPTTALTFDLDIDLSVTDGTISCALRQFYMEALD